jgi:hypothetical protein
VAEYSEFVLEWVDSKDRIYFSPAINLLQFSGAR